MTERFTDSYLHLCRKQGRALLSRLSVRPGDWLLGPDGLRLADQSGDAKKDADEVVVPDVERLLELLRAEAAVVVLDTQNNDYGLTAFDEMSRGLANVVSPSAPEACLRALLFIRSEKAASQIRLTPISE